MSEKFRDSQRDRHGVIGGILSSIKIPKMAKAARIFEDKRDHG